MAKADRLERLDVHREELELAYREALIAALDVGASGVLVNDRIASLLSATRTPRSPVLVTDAAIRRYVRKLIEKQHPQLPVLSYQELDPDVVIHHLNLFDETNRAS